MSRKLLADKIKHIRNERSWSQAQLAEIANVSLRTIQRIEKDGNCSHETLLSIAAAFDIDVKLLTVLIKHQNGLEAKNLEKYSHINYNDIKRKIIMTISKYGLIIISSGIFYLICLFALVAFTASHFHTFYQVLNPEIEAQLNSGYRQFLGFMGLGLALYLGIWSGIFGIWRKKIWQGVLILFLGFVITIGALELLPWIQFPHDQYPASASWVFSQTIPLTLSWLVITLFGLSFKKNKAVSGS